MTNNPGVVLFMSGAVAMGYAVAALFFLRFWRQTHDRLFAYFAAAFALLLVHRLALSAFATSYDGEIGYYVLRLLAFALIAIAVVEKNRTVSSKPR